MISSKPKFDIEMLDYCRNEREGCVTMVPRLHPETRELIANQTASQILDICNGERTLEKVVDEFAELYPDVDKNLLSQDVYSTLASYTRLGIISWIGENPFKTTLSCLLDENVIASIPASARPLPEAGARNERRNSEVVFIAHANLGRALQGRSRLGWDGWRQTHAFCRLEPGKVPLHLRAGFGCSKERAYNYICNSLS